MIMNTQAEAYILGWQACFDGEDGRYTNPCTRRSELAYAWDHGFLDAMEADDDDAAEPSCAGYGVRS